MNTMRRVFRIKVALHTLSLLIIGLQSSTILPPSSNRDHGDVTASNGDDP